ncbi:MAG: S1C family serine protease [Ruminiclostridium sp.]
MIDDKYEEINQNEEQNNAKPDNDQNIDTEASKTTQNEVIAQSDDITQGSDTVESDNTNQSDNINLNSDRVQSGEMTQSDGAAQNNDGVQSGETIQSDGTTLNNDSEITQSEDVTQSSDTTNGGSAASENNVNFEDTTFSRGTEEVNNDAQKIWQMQNSQNNGSGQDSNGANKNSYYKESYKRPNNKSSDSWKYILVSLVSAIVGGAILTVMLLGVAPMIQPQLRSFFGNNFPNTNIDSAGPSVSEIKKVEIVQTSDSAVTSVAEKVGPSVVGIRTTYQSANELFGEQAGGGEGSGIIISSDGYILTNHHVIENAINDKTRRIRSGAKIEVFLPSKIDKPYTATIQGYDSKTDLAVLKISETNLSSIEFGDSNNLKVGEPAIAFGNPGGLEYIGSLTTGVVSGLNRTVQLDGGRKIRLVQTDAAINPGNSGGALVNIKGQLIGVNTIKMVATGFEGLGFAIPVNDAKRIADELIKNTYISKPYLGITVDSSYTEEIAKENNMPMGVFVKDVEILGAAQKAGIKALDVIVKFNKKTVTSYDELEDEKNKLKPGDTVEIELFRDGNKKIIQVKLGETK